MSRSKGRSPSERAGHRELKPASDHAPSGADSAFVVGPWRLLFHPLLLDQLERLAAAAEKETAKRLPGEPEGPNTKLAASVLQFLFHEIPEDPSRPKYRQGVTLGADRKHWLRAKFGNGRFRLFFRYRQDVRLIVFTWVNDSETLRAYGSKTDAYAVFQRMLGTGNPPDDWDALVQAATAPDVLKRARAIFGDSP